MLKPAAISDGIEPIKLITEPDTRFFHCNIKTLNLIPSVMASEKAKRAGCQETVFYREGGRVTECAHSNVHIIKDGALYTAPLDNLILPGIARKHLIQACDRLGISVHEEPYYLEDLFAAEEVLVTSSSNLCLHAHEIGGKPVGGMQPELIEALRKEVIGEFSAQPRPIKRYLLRSRLVANASLGVLSVFATDRAWMPFVRDVRCLPFV